MQLVVHPDALREIKTDTFLRPMLAPGLAESAFMRLGRVYLLCAILALFSIFFQSMRQARAAKPIPA